MSLPRSKRFEVIVIGAGPAGSTAARRLALKGRSVLLLERNKLPRHKACGGGLTGKVEKILDFDIKDVVENSATRILYAFQGKRSAAFELEGFKVNMVKRDQFDHLLAKKAVEAGVILIDQAPVKQFKLQNGIKIVETEKSKFIADVLIGADGATGITARAAELRQNAQIGIAIDAERTVSDQAFQEWKHTLMFDFGGVPGGYGWAFPKHDHFSVGVGTSRTRMPEIRTYLDELIHNHRNLTEGRSIAVRAAPLPYWTQTELLARDGVFLAGDAAGLVDPLSGEGISYALRSAVMSAEFADAHLSGERNAEAGYTDAIEQNIGRGFSHAHNMAVGFYKHPALSYNIFVRSEQANRLFAKLIAGDISYVELTSQLRDSLPGRISRLMKPLVRLFR